MPESDQAIALLISLQERVNKVFDDIKADRELDRGQLAMLVDRVEKLEQAGVEVKKHNKTDIGAIVQNPTVIIATIALVAVLALAEVDLNVVLTKFLEWLNK